MALSRRSGARFQASIWPGFVDAMTGLLLVLFFVLSIFMAVQFVLRETISGQESQLDALGGEVAALSRALGLSEARGNELQARVGALTATLETSQTRVEDLTATLTQAQARVSQLLGERDAANEALGVAQTRITSFEAQVTALLAERDGALGQVDALQTREAELLTQTEALDLALAEARDEVDANTEAARLAAARREALQALITDLRARNADAQAQAGALQSDLVDAQAALSEQETARLTEAAAAQALRERLSEADAELTAMTLALENQRQRAEDTLTLLAAAQAVESELDSRLATALLRLEAAETARAGDAETLAATRQERAALQAEADSLRRQLDAAVAAQVGQGDALAEVQAQRDALQSRSEDLRTQLAQALAARLAAESLANDESGAADRQAALLAAARSALSQEEEKSADAQRQTALLNQQVAALRTQLGELQALLDDARARDAVQEVQLESLGSELNTALARVAAEERRRLVLEQAETVRLAEEAARLAAEAQNLERYRSEFFGQLRDLLGTQEGVRVVGDRFVFSSEVLFPVGSASLSPAGQAEIAKVAGILGLVSGDIPAQIDWVLQVDGHTDNVPLSGTGAFADNWELSQARALSVVRYMVDGLGLPPDRLSANGFGEFQPVAEGDSPQARAQNRRIEIKFTEK